MNERAKANAIRAGIVVIGSLAFGYLSFQIGFKPFLEKAQEFDSLQQSSHSSSKSQEE
ncbi:hypothetical protein SLEP1_g46460 [Rubroshorea leprosula]|uniref:Uncharacterized protein n=1 Tax=Rubroshorea leprosula TaxID=152421 RepID=A0AAV5LMX3_9ROSI|nr:hypothetical protein SLEP1_g46460 [Rubroshorea leprosula]